MSHTCHAHGCAIDVPPRMFVCPHHWRALPAPIKSAIYREYRSGQEVRKDPTTRYMAVQRQAVGTLAFKPNDEHAATIAAPYFIEAQIWRQRALDEGAGDPLAGLCGPHVRIDEERARQMCRELRLAGRTKD